MGLLVKVKLKTLMAGPKGTFARGSVVQLPAADADHLVLSGQADYAERTEVRGEDVVQAPERARRRK